MICPPRTFGDTPTRPPIGLPTTSKGVGSFPVLPSVEPGDVRRTLPDTAPTEGEPFETLMEEFQSKILAGVTHWNHPAFFAYFPTTGSGPGILGEMLAAALNVNAMVWKTSPAATELEELALTWVRELVGLPDVFRETINDTASSSSLNALTAARDATFPGVRERGLFGAPADGSTPPKRPICPSTRQPWCWALVWTECVTSRPTANTG